jgi:hypothetical protein
VSDQPTDIMKVIHDWIESASDPKSGDQQLTIKRVGFGKSALTGQLERVSFVVEATHAVVGFSKEVAGSQIVAPPPGLVGPLNNKNH